jgi:hypothetical protein
VVYPLSSLAMMGSSEHHHENSQSIERSEETTPVNQLIWTSTVLIQQALTLLNENISSDDQLTFQSRLLPGSTIGKQIRHAHAHFSLLLEAITSSQTQQWVVNYDVRQRNTPMETSTQSAKEALLSLIDRLEKLKDFHLRSEDPIVVNAVTPDRQVLQSSFGREVSICQCLLRIALTLHPSYGLPHTMLFTIGPWSEW